MRQAHPLTKSLHNLNRWAVHALAVLERAANAEGDSGLPLPRFTHRDQLLAGEAWHRVFGVKETIDAVAQQVTQEWLRDSDTEVAPVDLYQDVVTALARALHGALKRCAPHFTCPLGGVQTLLNEPK